MSRRLQGSLLVLIFCASFAAAVHPERVRVSSSVMQGLVMKKVPPDYPPLARQARIQGTVTLRVRISKTGDVINIELVSGHPMLAPAAIEAVKQWKYKPYLLNGEPMEVETEVSVNFTLSDKPPAEGTVGGHPTGAGEAHGVAGTIIAGTTAAPGRIRVSQGVESGLIVKKVSPMYPDAARQQRIQGVVLLAIEVDKQGNVAKVELISGDPALAPAAIEAARQWKYKPYLLNQTPVVVETQVQVNFTLAS